MNRKDFLKSCACGLCACATTSLIPSADLSAAEAAKTEDWRLPFVKDRYAKLLQILGDKVDEKTMNEILRQLGRNCASTMPIINQHKGDIEGFITDFKNKYHEDITYDREKGLITVVGQERSDCVCPLIGIKNKTPKIACNCSLGWQQYVYETILGKEARVELKETVLRGGKRCAFEIRIGNDLPAKNS
jgi:hypothetical protein